MKYDPQSDAPSRAGGVSLQVVLSLLCIAVGASLLFVPQISIQMLCIAFCGILIIAGVSAIVYFFLSGAFQRLREYSFSLGALFVILGCCGLAQLEALSGAFLIGIGFVILILGIMLLQSAIQLAALDSRVCVIGFLFAILTLAAAIAIIIGFSPIKDFLIDFAAISLFAAGILSLFISIVTAIVIHRSLKALAKAELPAEEVPVSKSQPAPAEETPVKPADPEQTENPAQ